MCINGSKFRVVIIIMSYEGNANYAQFLVYNEYQRNVHCLKYIIHINTVI